MQVGEVARLRVNIQFMHLYLFKISFLCCFKWIMNFSDIKFKCCKKNVKGQ